MCTAMVTQASQGDIYSGRAMNFSYPLEPELYVVPKGFQRNNIMSTHQIHNRYRFMGIGQGIPPVVFVDGVNEMGFGVITLYSLGRVRYDSPDPKDLFRPVVIALKLAGFLLGLSASVEEVAFILRIVRTAGAQDSITGAIAPLHWPVADRTGRSMVIEETADGLHLMGNPISVLFNSPDLQWYLTNLRNYMNLSASQNQSQTWGSLELTPSRQGVGSFEPSGDYMSPSRFVRTVSLKTHTPIPAGREEAALTRFYIMESVSIPKGPIIIGQNAPDYTQYTAFISLSSREYFSGTYDNSHITSASLSDNPNTKSDMKSLAVFNQLAAFRRLPEPLGAF